MCDLKELTRNASGFGRGQNARYIFELLSQFKRGECDGIKVRLGRLQEFVSSACVEHLDFLSDQSGRHHDITFNVFQEKVTLHKRFKVAPCSCLQTKATV